MSAETCPTCNLPVANPEDVIAGRARYADTCGGHADRHTLVLEAAERASRIGVCTHLSSRPQGDGKWYCLMCGWSWWEVAR